MNFTEATLFWGFLVVYGVVMYVLSPKSKNANSFYKGADDQGNPVSQWSLTASIFISWIFAKSVTNAANLGAAYGVVGGLAYASYWLSIPVAGYVIYLIRTQTGARSLQDFLTSRFGRLASLAFAAAILIRLYNEVWSNTAVVGGYFGLPGEWEYYAAAMLFTVFTLAYSLKGGLRSSIFTDVIQAFVFVFFVGAVLFLIIPANDTSALLTNGEFRLNAGFDLLLVALLQLFSYPFHDPVLTDRGFVNKEKTMLKSFVVAGLLGFVAVFIFSLVGVHARLNGIEAMGNAPAAVGQSLGLAALFFMSVVMMTSAGSTLDSTFTFFGQVPGGGSATAGEACIRQAAEHAGGGCGDDYLRLRGQPAHVCRYRYPQGHHYLRNDGHGAGAGVPFLRFHQVVALEFPSEFLDRLEPWCLAGCWADSLQLGYWRWPIRHVAGRKRLRLPDLYRRFLCPFAAPASCRALAGCR